jgi:signal peptidase II
VTMPALPVPRRWKLFLLVGLLSLVLDQASKYWARHSLPVVANPVAGDCSVLPDGFVAHTCGIKRDAPCCWGDQVDVVPVWAWRLSFNPGSAFGLFHSASGARIFLSIVGILAVIGMGWMVRRAKDSQTWLIVALALVAGGAVGNLIDRIYFGVVTDFALLHWKETEWPVFNVADVALVVGVVLLVFDVGKEGKKDKKGSDRKAKKAAKDAAAEA